MIPVLDHHPEGDRNPYEAVVWSRRPYTPTDSDQVRVGVKAAPGVEHISVEFDRDHDPVSLVRVDGSEEWVATVGPFTRSCRYRFVSSYGDTTDWFELPVVVSVVGQVRSLVVAGGQVLAVADNGAAIRLAQTMSGGLDWSVEPYDGSEHAGGSSSEDLGSWNFTVEDGVLTLRSQQVSLVIEWISLGSVGTDLREISVGWRLEDREALFGGGERFDRVDQRGLTPDVRVYEQYKQQGGRTYFPLPWLLSSRGYGLHVLSDERVRFDLGASKSDQAVMSVPAADSVAGRLYTGSPAEVISEYVHDVGRPTPLPLWAYGPWMSGNEWDRESRVREVVERTLAEDIPATALVIEAWSDETTFYLFNDTTYEEVPGSDPVPVESMRHAGRWPDPKGLVDWLHERGIAVLLWQIPVLKNDPGHPQHDADVVHADAQGYCVQTENGTPYRNRGWWFPGARVLDMSHPGAREWWFAKRSYLVDHLGIDGFKTDGGEHLWGLDVVTAAGEEGHAAANRYPTHYLGAYHEFLTQRGHSRPVTFSRAGFTGSQAFPAHWAGDEDSTWEAYRASLTAGLSAGLSGVAFWSWDLGGFSGPRPDAELYKRASAMAAFCPIMQYHSEHNEHRQPLADRTPWNVADQTGDPTVTDIYAFYARLRMNLVPYLNQLGVHASETGQPLMRALALDYPDDPSATAIDDQYLLGQDLLVAPVLEPGIEERAVYLPSGEWYDLWTGRSAPSGWNTVKAPIDRIPVFVRGGAAVPLWLEELTLGTPVDLPGGSKGERVVAVHPGTRETALVDPVSGLTWRVDAKLDGNLLEVSASAVPEGVTLWVRGTGGSDETAELPSGSSTHTFSLAGA